MYSRVRRVLLKFHFARHFDSPEQGEFNYVFFSLKFLIKKRFESPGQDYRMPREMKFSEVCARRKKDSTLYERNTLKRCIL